MVSHPDPPGHPLNPPAGETMMTHPLFPLRSIDATVVYGLDGTVVTSDERCAAEALRRMMCRVFGRWYRA